MDTETSVATLNDLYQLVCDSIKGYDEASSKVKTPQLASFLSTLASDRREMKQHLGEVIHQFHPDEDLDQGTLKGDLHRAWISIREALSASSDRSVLEECARGEEYLAERFQTVMVDKETPPEAMFLLRQQASKVAVTRSTIKELSKTIEYDNG